MLSSFQAELSTTSLSDEVPNVSRTQRAMLRDELVSELHDIATDSHLTPGFGKGLWLAKGRRNDLLDCDARILYPESFEPTLAIAEGIVSESAVMTDWMSDGVNSPVLVAEQVLDQYLRKATQRRPDKCAVLLSDVEDDARSEVIEAMSARINAFRTILGPIDRAGFAVTQQRDIKLPIGQGEITLAGVLDLHVAPRTNASDRLSAHVELKTGQGNINYKLHEPRYYALLEALVKDAALPQRVGIVNLDTGDHHVDEVDLPLLQTAAEDTLKAVRRYVALTAPEGPTVPLKLCGRSWCSGCATHKKANSGASNAA